MDDLVAEATLIELERRRLATLVAADIPAAVQLHAPDYELITPGGASLDRDEYLGSIEDGSIRYRRFEPVSSIRVHLRPETAILRYRVLIDITFPGGHERGEFWHTDYYERRDGDWLVVWSQATRIRTAGSD